MKQHHSWTLDEIESMYPWEREVYVAMLKQHIEEENDRIKQRQQ